MSQDLNEEPELPPHQRPRLVATGRDFDFAEFLRDFELPVDAVWKAGDTVPLFDEPAPTSGFVIYIERRASQLWEQEADTFDFLLRYGVELSALRGDPVYLEAVLYPYELAGRRELSVEPSLLALMGGLGITLNVAIHEFTNAVQRAGSHASPLTEANWLTCTDPTPMLEFLRNGSGRKLRLFACACCRRVSHLLTDEASRLPLEAVERHADGLASDEELAEATGPLEVVAPRDQLYPNAPAYYATWQNAPDAASSTAQAAVEAVQNAAGDPDAERAAQAAMLRDIFGNPFRHVSVDPSWLAWNDGTVVKIAQGVYEERAFDRLAILADALRDAGCYDEAILEHCRQPGPHVRGCWIVDLILGRE